MSACKLSNNPLLFNGPSIDLALFCRTILAALHFNYNLRRETKVDDRGEPRLRVFYPKFKEGEATVKEVRIKPNFCTFLEKYIFIIVCLQTNIYISKL